MASCDLARPTRADLIGKWVVKSGQTADIGAEMELLADGRVVLREWPGDWLRTDATKRHSARGRWQFNPNDPDTHEAAFFLKVSSIDDGSPPKFDGPVYWSSFLDKQRLEIIDRDPDEGNPQFQKVR